jgi:hypothetical protein
MAKKRSPWSFIDPSLSHSHAAITCGIWLVPDRSETGGRVGVNGRHFRMAGSISWLGLSVVGRRGPVDSFCHCVCRACLLGGRDNSECEAES